jgi:hypothetical protein
VAVLTRHHQLIPATKADATRVITALAKNAWKPLPK